MSQVCELANRMRILLIISQYLPAQTPNTLRWVPILDYFYSKGIELHILTTERTGYPAIEKTDKATIHRAGHNTLLDKLYNVLKSNKRRNEVGSNPPSYSGGVLQGLVDKTWRKRYWPDGSQLFLKPGIKQALKLTKAQEFSHIISVGLPFTCHLIAQKVKEQNKSIHWLMDIQDPFCYSKEFRVNNYDKYKDRNIVAEKQAFELADVISITNERAKEKYKLFFPEQISKVKIIPPLFFIPKEEESYNMYLYSEKVHLAYFGSFYEGVRSPLSFLKFLKFLHNKNNKLFDQIQFHIVGQLDRKSSALFEQFPEIRRYIVLHGFMNRAKTLDAMSQPQILLNFGNSTDYHLPSKVVDFLYMNKPIVNFTSIDQDSTQAFLQDKVELLNLKLEEEKFELMAQEFLSFVLKNRKTSAPEIEKVRIYQSTNISEEYLQLLQTSKEI